MSINRKELKKIIYDFNSISSRLLRAEYDEVDNIVAKFLSYIDNNTLICDYIKDCGDPAIDVEDEVNKVINSYGREIFNLGISDEDEVSNVYNILKYCSENGISIVDLGDSYSSSNKYNDWVKAFGERVIMILVRHIEGFLTKIGIDMDMNENIKYEITVNNGQVNLATDNATVNAMQNNGLNMSEFKKLIDDIKRESVNISNASDLETINESIEVIENELNQSSPKKSLIKTAIIGLKAVKGTAEFGAAIIALVQFLQTIL